MIHTVLSLVIFAISIISATMLRVLFSFFRILGVNLHFHTRPAVGTTSISVIFRVSVLMGIFLKTALCKHAFSKIVSGNDGFHKNAISV